MLKFRNLLILNSRTYLLSSPLCVEFHSESTDAFKSRLKQEWLRSEVSHIYSTQYANHISIVRVAAILSTRQS